MDLEVISKSGTAVAAHNLSKTPKLVAPYPVKPLDCSWFLVADGACRRRRTRELMADVEGDLGTKLDWVAVDPWNTDNPHVHICAESRRTARGSTVDRAAPSGPVNASR